MKPDITDFIIDAEKRRGSVITADSRITCDSFFDNSDIDNPYMASAKVRGGIL